MARVLFSTIGSWGDLFPVIGVAQEVQRRGHDVEITASPAWRDLVDGAGLPFTPVGRWIGFDDFAANPEIFGPMPFALRTLLRRFVFDQLDDLTDDLRDPIRRADLVVAHAAHVVALAVAEQSGTPAAVASVFPSMLPSVHRVPGGTPFGPWRGSLGRLAHRSLWAAADLGASALFDRPINAHRRSLGLPRVRNALVRLPLRTSAVVLLADPLVVDPPPDWPTHVHVTSSVDWDRIGSSGVDGEVEAFLDSGAPPVLVTLGTSTATVAGDFFAHAADCLLARGERVLTVTGPAPAGRDSGSGRALSVRTVPFSAVLPRCRAVIHHAGIGTSTAALRAGLPQLAVPKSHDQPDTAAMVERLGVGLQVPWKRRHRDLGERIDAVLDDGRFADRAHAVAAELAGRDGAVLAADVIERLVPP